MAESAGQRSAPTLRLANPLHITQVLPTVIITSAIRFVYNTAYPNKQSFTVCRSQVNLVNIYLPKRKRCRNNSHICMYCTLHYMFPVAVTVGLAGAVVFLVLSAISLGTRNAMLKDSFSLKDATF